MRLPADNPHVQLVRHSHIAGEIVRGHRLLQPVNIVFLDALAGVDRHVRGPTHIHVDHDIDVRAQRFPHAPHVLHVGAPIPDMRHLHLDRLKTLADEMLRLGNHPVAQGAAKATAAIDRDLRAEIAPQPVQRHPRAFTHRIPQRDIEGRNRHQRDAGTARSGGGAIQIRPDRFHRRRVLAQHARDNHFPQMRRNGAHARRKWVQVAHAGDAAGGFYLHQQDFALHVPERAARQPGIVLPRDGQHRHPDVLDGHVGHRVSPLLMRRLAGRARMREPGAEGDPHAVRHL